MSSKSRETIQLIQHELARKGFDPGVIDGIWGRRTEGAVRTFQASNGLVIDGIVGPVTWQKLFGSPSAVEPINSPAIPWFQEARRLIGLKERVGPGNEPKIIDWAKDAGIAYSSDDIPWCGLFVAHCVSSTLGEESLPANPLGARQWLRFGAPCPKPVPGSILVFWRDKRTSFKGHVGFYAGQEKGTGVLHVLGGNQSNSVSIARIAPNRLLEARWPATVPISGDKVEIASGQTMFSTNEA
jgi:uncharacterized protein (TIGR02594 family)